MALEDHVCPGRGSAGRRRDLVGATPDPQPDRRAGRAVEGTSLAPPLTRIGTTAWGGGRFSSTLLTPPAASRPASSSSPGRRSGATRRPAARSSRGRWRSGRCPPGRRASGPTPRASWPAIWARHSNHDRPAVADGDHAVPDPDLGDRPVELGPVQAGQGRIAAHGHVRRARHEDEPAARRAAERSERRGIGAPRRPAAAPARAVSDRPTVEAPAQVVPDQLELGVGVALDRRPGWQPGARRTGPRRRGPARRSARRSPAGDRPGRPPGGRSPTARGGRSSGSPRRSSGRSARRSGRPSPGRGSPAARAPRRRSRPGPSRSATAWLNRIPWSVSWRVAQQDGVEQLGPASVRRLTSIDSHGYHLHCADK